MLTATEAAEAAGLSKNTIIRAIRKGALSAQRDSLGAFKIDPAEFARWREAEARDRLEAVTWRDMAREPSRDMASHGTPSRDKDEGGGTGRAELEKVKAEARAEIAEAEAAQLRERLAEIREERDAWKAEAAAWRGQAEKLLLPPPAPEPPAHPAPLHGASPSPDPENPRPSLWRRLFG